MAYGAEHNGSACAGIWALTLTFKPIDGGQFRCLQAHIEAFFDLLLHLAVQSPGTLQAASQPSSST